MPQDSLLKTLEEDAEAQSRSIIEEADESAASAITQAEAEAARIKEERLKELNLSIARERAAAINGARLRMNGLKLKVRHEIIEGVINEAIEKVRELPKDEYSDLFNKLYMELKRDWNRDRPNDRPLAHINPDDMGIIKDPDAETVPDKDVRLGIVFTSKDGKVRYENTIPGRVARARAGLEAAVNKMLFG